MSSRPIGLQNQIPPHMQYGAGLSDQTSRPSLGNVPILAFVDASVSFAKPPTSTTQQAASWARRPFTATTPAVRPVRPVQQHVITSRYSTSSYSPSTCRYTSGVSKRPSPYSKPAPKSFVPFPKSSGRGALPPQKGAFGQAGGPLAFAPGAFGVRGGADVYDGERDAVGSRWGKKSAVAANEEADTEEVQTSTPTPPKTIETPTTPVSTKPAVRAAVHPSRLAQIRSNTITAAATTKTTATAVVVAQQPVAPTSIKTFVHPDRISNMTESSSDGGKQPSTAADRSTGTSKWASAEPAPHTSPEPVTVTKAKSTIHPSRIKNVQTSTARASTASTAPIASPAPAQPASSSNPRELTSADNTVPGTPVETTEPVSAAASLERTAVSSTPAPTSPVPSKRRSAQTVGSNIPVVGSIGVVPPPTTARTTASKSRTVANGTGASKWAASPPSASNNKTRNSASTEASASKSNEVTSPQASSFARAVATVPDPPSKPVPGSSLPVKPKDNPARPRPRKPSGETGGSRLMNQSLKQNTAPAPKQRDNEKEARLDDLMARMKLKNEKEAERVAAVQKEKADYEEEVRREQVERQRYIDEQRAIEEARRVAEAEKRERSARLQAAVNAARAEAAQAKRKKATAREWDRSKVDRATPEPSMRPSEQLRAQEQEREEALAAERDRHGGTLPKYRADEVWESVQHHDD
ncbi:hypothetical protein OIO90_000683 [Microbotryomycetes sp. JL221]|nr:hypothetical protein OIO90_000683 [Microbotryomycetes sp. JL221]